MDNLLDVSEGLVSDQKGLSKDSIRILSERFKHNQAFNRAFELHVPVNPKFKDARMMNSHKKLATAF